MWIVKPFWLAWNDFCTLPLNIRIKTNYSRVIVEAYCFERALAFVSVQSAFAHGQIDNNNKFISC